MSELRKIIEDDIKEYGKAIKYYKTTKDIESYDTIVHIAKLNAIKTHLESILEEYDLEDDEE